MGQLTAGDPLMSQAADALALSFFSILGQAEQRRLQIRRR